MNCGGEWMHHSCQPNSTHPAAPTHCSSIPPPPCKQDTLLRPPFHLQPFAICCEQGLFPYWQWLLQEGKESWNHRIAERLGLEGTLKPALFKPLAWAGLPPTSSGCLGPHPPWPWAPPGMGQCPTYIKNWQDDKPGTVQPPTHCWPCPLSAMPFLQNKQGPPSFLASMHHSPHAELVADTVLPRRLGPRQRPGFQKRCCCRKLALLLDLRLPHPCFPGQRLTCFSGGLEDTKALCKEMPTLGHLGKLSLEWLQHCAPTQSLKTSDREFLRLISYTEVCVSPVYWIIASQIFYVLQLNFFFSIKGYIPFLCDIFLRVIRDQ